jgi:hypothetical protein
MKKLIFFLLFGALSFSAFSQVTLTAEEKNAKAEEEMKTALTAHMAIPADAAEKILAIEDEFRRKLAGIEAQTNFKVKEREIKLNEAHVTRRTKLMEIPLTGRQMEDVISLVETIRRKHKL